MRKIYILVYLILIMVYIYSPETLREVHLKIGLKEETACKGKRGDRPWALPETFRTFDPEQRCDTCNEIYERTFRGREC